MQEKEKSEITQQNRKLLPTVALRGLVLLPGGVTHFDINRKRSLSAVEAAMAGDQMIYLVAQRRKDTEEPGQEDLFAMGITARIRQVIRMQNSVVRVLISEGQRARLRGLESGKGYLEAEVEPVDPEEGNDLVPMARPAMISSIRETFGQYAKLHGKLPKEVTSQILETKDLETLMDLTAFHMPVDYPAKQEILETVSLTARYEKLLKLLFHEIEVVDLKNELQSKVKAKVDKSQREYLLREELAVIREELGESIQSDADRYEEKLAGLECTEEVREHLAGEIRRFRNIPSNAAESTVMRNYIETLLELPWEHRTEDHHDLKNARRILDRDHYGMKDVKDRVLDFLAVRSLTGKGESPIICLVGPPGTGKTSIARSVAEALGRNYVRVCLGGVHDEAEIRGHRRTYVGAMPGRITEALKQAKTKNPLMLLDEIDKAGADFKGDPEAALLEVLDSEQNSHFRDHFVEVPIDLSEVMFICTANSLHSIARPLLDRMEVIEVPSYTDNEKLHIAKEHLLDKQRKANGLQADQLTITDGAYRNLIYGYTAEAGVRSLERQIGSLCRKAARAIAEGEESSLHVTKKNLEKYLGEPTHIRERRGEKPQIGIARGLAWTAVGGVTMEIEVSVMPGDGGRSCTGQLGDVMKESVSVGSTWVRAYAAENYGIDKEFYKQNDIHIHIPDGATPKDGPSAGITMATAMLSAIVGKPIRPEVAMTGEISLRGRVMPIGGLREKLLAAKNIGITTVIIPEDNRRNLKDISTEITDGLEIIPVKTMEEVIRIAFA